MAHKSLESSMLLFCFYYSGGRGECACRKGKPYSWNFEVLEDYNNLAAMEDIIKDLEVLTLEGKV